MAIKRVHYFDHQFLVESDFNDEQSYHLEQRRRLSRVLHTPGIAEGLQVAKSSNKSVVVRAGMAIDRSGREVILESDQPVDLSDAALFPPNARVFIAIEYREQATDPTTATGITDNTRVTEQPVLSAATTAPAPNGPRLPLATFLLDATASVPGNTNDVFDGGVRQVVGPRGERGIASLNNISSPAGNVDLVGGTGIVITADPNNRRVSIASSTTGLASLDGVSNAGGNIDLVAAQSLVITPDDANNRITISENHSARTDNPHGVTLAQIGALAATDYDLRRRSIVSVAFSQIDANGAVRTAPLGFQARLALVTGNWNAGFAGRAYGGTISAFADFTPGAAQPQTWVTQGLTRFSDTNWFLRAFNSVASGGFAITNSEVSPAQQETLTLLLAATATGVSLTLGRVGAVPLPSFTIAISVLCLG